MKNRIAIIVTWMEGDFPPYFPIWLRSVEMNPEVDFFIFYNPEAQEIKSEKTNIHAYRTTMAAEVERAARALGEPVNMQGGYKFSELRPFYGIIYQEYLAGYDFWGYCDLDLAFGHIRSFLTDEVLSQYDRFYEWGHLSVYRNNEKMNRLFDLPGSLYTMDEMLRSNFRVGSEEHNGVNRICKMNNIPWYTKPDMADFYTFYPDWILWNVQLKNYTHQVFYWENGRVFRAAVDEQGGVITDEFIYIHWQKRHPVIDREALNSSSFYIFPDRFIAKTADIPLADEIIRLTPVVPKSEHLKNRRAYMRAKMADFFRSPTALKKIRIRQKWTMLRETGSVFAERKRNANNYDRERGI